MNALKVSYFFLLLFSGSLAFQLAYAQEHATSVDPVKKALSSYPNNPKLAGHFSGRVTDLEGKPVRGARLFIVPNWGLSTAHLSEGGTAVICPIKTIGQVRAETDPSGHFEFDAPDMAYTTVDGFPSRRQGLLVATAEGFAPDWIAAWGDNSAYGSHWDPVRGAALDLQLGLLGPSIEGRLLAPDGKPLEGALVRLTKLLIPEDRDLDAHLAHQIRGYGFLSGPDYERTLIQPSLISGLKTETRTNKQGRFTFSGLGRDWLAVMQVSQPSVVDTGLTVMTRDALDFGIKSAHKEVPASIVYGANFTLKFGPGRTIKGRVVDLDSGEPIPGMWVGPRQNHYAGVSGELFRWRTDEDGRFTITGLPPKLALGEIVMAVAPSGVPYQTAGEWIVGNNDVVIKCPRGIPFRLKVLDEKGKPVDAEVSYVDVIPNPHVENLIPWAGETEQQFWPNAPAARRADGTYEGFVMPGPGAILVKTPRSAGYRPAHVNPKGFFAPGRREWTESDEWAYGTDDSLSIGSGLIDQTDYAAIILVNPPPGSEPIKLTTTVIKDKPRQVNLVDAHGQPVEIEVHRGRTPYRTSTVMLTGLHPHRSRPLTYVHEEQRLVGSLLARGDGDSTYTVTMQPWAAVIGRVTDENGNPLSGAIVAIESDDPAERDRHLGGESGDDGLFRVEKLIPGHRYSAKIYRGSHNINGRLYRLFIGEAFQDLSLGALEIHDLGDLTTKPPSYEEFPLVYEPEQDERQ